MSAEIELTGDRSPKKEKKSYRILLVDDDPETVDLLTQWFRMDGYDVQSVSGGREAIDLVRKSPPDLILLDLLLPEEKLGYP